ncbi:MAG: fumarylacetoacetate hydrolase family protein [Pseudomonadota bacterium]
MSQFVLTPPERPSLAVKGRPERFAVRRVYCIGKNYVAHIKEMNADERDPPVIFMKPTDAVVPGGGEIPYPVFTENLHYECELVVALKSGGYNIAEADAEGHIFGYAVGLDMTRRDHQARALEKGLPWEVTKAFDKSAPIGAITPVETSGLLHDASVQLKVNGEIKQDANVSLMIWKTSEIIAKLSQQHCLEAGDLIMTGTPAGVGAVTTGDTLECSVAGVDPMTVTIGARAA